MWLNFVHPSWLKRRTHWLKFSSNTNKLTKDDLTEVTKNKWHQAKNYATTDSNAEVLNRFEVSATQIFPEKISNFLQAILFGKLPIIVEQSLLNNIKWNEFCDKPKAFLHHC